MESKTMTVRAARKGDVTELSGTLARAFSDDPVMTWILPTARSRSRRLRPMFATMTRHHFLAGGGVEVAVLDGKTILGATLWDPPGQWKQSAREERRMVPGFTWAFRLRAPVVEKVLQMLKQNHPEEPHWYLGFIGSDPTIRGTGFGHALMRSGLDRCDAEHAPAYLESSNRENVPYYQRFGFEVMGQLKIPGGGPTMWPMWRDPR